MKDSDLFSNLPLQSYERLFNALEFAKFVVGLVLFEVLF